MGFTFSKLFHNIAESIDCGLSKEELEEIISKELENRQNINSIKDDIHEMKELVGFLGMRIAALEKEEQKKENKAQIISINQ